MTLSLEDFAAKRLWEEHIRLRGYLSDFEAGKHFRKTLRQIRRGKLGIERNTEWAAMVRGWYRQYLAEVTK